MEKFRVQSSDFRVGVRRRLALSRLTSYFFLLALFLLFTFHFSLFTPAFAEEAQTVTAEGVAAIDDGNKAIARDNALKDAQRKAVEQAVGTMISSETAVQNFQLLSDKIFSQSQGYIQSYKIVSEGAFEGTLYKVAIQASVATGGLKNDLGALGLLMQKVEKPRVLFMIAEQNVGQEFYSFWWYGKSEFKGQHYDMAASETALKEEFLAKGFNLVDSSVATGKIEVSNAYRIADLTDSGATSIAKQLGAEVVIRGKAIAKEGPRTSGSNVATYIADISASALRVDTGGVIASGRGHGVSRNISQITGGTEALERAAKELAEKMIDQITTKWTAETSGGGLVQLTVRGIGSYSDFVKFKDMLQGQIRGVQAVYQRSLDGGTAVIDVEIKGTAQNLADDISKKKVGGVPVKVISATANTVEVNLDGK